MKKGYVFVISIIAMCLFATNLTIAQQQPRFVPLDAVAIFASDKKPEDSTSRSADINSAKSWLGFLQKANLVKTTKIIELYDEDFNLATFENKVGPFYVSPNDERIFMFFSSSHGGMYKANGQWIRYFSSNSGQDISIRIFEKIKGYKLQIILANSCAVYNSTDDSLIASGTADFDYPNDSYARLLAWHNLLNRYSGSLFIVGAGDNQYAFSDSISGSYIFQSFFGVTSQLIDIQTTWEDFANFVVKNTEDIFHTSLQAGSLDSYRSDLDDINQNSQTPKILALPERLPTQSGWTPSFRPYNGNR